MRSGIRLMSLVLLASTALLVAPAPAQSVTPCVQFLNFSMDRELFLPTRQKPAPAYTATIKQTYEQTLPDGNTIHWISESIQARDENGRTFRQRIQGCDIDSNGQPQLRTQVDIYDPATKSTTTWGTGPGSMMLVTVMHPQTNLAPDWKDIPRTPAIRFHAQTEFTTEDLGTRTIAGMLTTGRRTTQLIPAGEQGNDMPLKLVHENWVDKESHATLMTISDDPRMGRHTWEVESLTLGPPDPALFNPPTNYKVWDRNPQQQTATTAAAP